MSPTRTRTATSAGERVRPLPVTPPTDGQLGAAGTRQDGLSPRRRRPPLGVCAPKSRAEGPGPSPGPPCCPLGGFRLRGWMGVPAPRPFGPPPCLSHRPSPPPPLPLCTRPPFPPGPRGRCAGCVGSSVSWPHPRPWCGLKFRFPELVWSGWSQKCLNRLGGGWRGLGSSGPAALLWPWWEALRETQEGVTSLLLRVGGRGTDPRGAGPTAGCSGLGGLGRLCRGAWGWEVTK